MAKVFIEETTLSAIGDAIRTKTETTELINPADMAEKIEGITTGGNTAELTITSNGTYKAPEGIDGYTPVIVNVPQDGSPPAEAFILRGDCSYRFANGGWDWFLNRYGNQITTGAISKAVSMFSKCSAEITTFPFNINLLGTINAGIDCSSMFILSKFKYLTDENVAGIAGRIGIGQYMFSDSDFIKIPSLTFNNNRYYNYDSIFNKCYYLEEIGDLVNLYPDGMSDMFSGCYRLKTLPNFINPNFERVNTYKYDSIKGLLSDCRSLRTIPESFMNTLNLIKKTTSSFYASYALPLSLFSGCYTLEEIVNLPLGVADDAEITSNMFANTFYQCHRLKRLTFKMNDDSTPKVMKLKNQIIDLSTSIGFSIYESSITDYNSGLTTDTQIIGDATYQALKDNLDSWTIDINYSRYNRTSAVETINSLPDTSAYGTNTIKFEGASGALTDGGAINTMTEEEIAVATAKGWTVSFV